MNNHCYGTEGGVDLDCHLTVSSLEDPVADTYLSGSRAALLGGTTTIVNTIYTEPEASLVDAVDQFTDSAANQFACDYAITMRLPRFDNAIASQLQQLVASRGLGLIQLAIGSGRDSCDHQMGALSDEACYNLFRECHKLGILPIVQANTAPFLTRCLQQQQQLDGATAPELHDYTHPARGEADTIRRVALHAFHAGHQICPVLISRLHSPEALRCFIEQRRACRGLLFGQTTIGAIGAALSAVESEESGGHAMFTKARDWSEAASYIYEPPLRQDVHLSRQLMLHLTTNVGLTVGSGHVAVRDDVRAAVSLRRGGPIPPGMASLGARLPVLWHCGLDVDGGMDLGSFVRAMSTEPARLANLYPRKGHIAPNSDADLIVWSKTGSNVTGFGGLLPEGVHNVFDGFTLKSRPQLVLLRGRIVVREGKLVQPEGECYGEYIPIAPFGQYAFGRLKAIDQSRRADWILIEREPYTGPVVGSKVAEPERESHYFRKEHFDNVPKVALPPGQRQIHTSVKTAQPPGGSSHVFW